MLTATHPSQRIDGEFVNNRTANIIAVTSTGAHNQECVAIAAMAILVLDTRSMRIWLDNVGLRLSRAASNYALALRASATLSSSDVQGVNGSKSRGLAALMH
jgi:hypothetical protein